MDNFIVQDTLKVCRGAVGWSAGRNICCIYELAIQVTPGQVLRVAGAANRPTLNGQPWSGSKNFGGGISGSCNGNSCTVNHPDVRVQIVQSPPYSSYTITLMKRNGKFHAPGRATGTCGGMGEQQFKYPAVRGPNGAIHKYPCKTCVPGGAYRTAMCKCEEFQVPQNKALTAMWKQIRKASGMETLAEMRTKVQRKKASLSKLIPQKLSQSSCYTKFQASKFMKHAWDNCPQLQNSVGVGNCHDEHIELAERVHEFIIACAADIEAGGTMDSVVEKTEEQFCGLEIAEGFEDQEYAKIYCGDAQNPGMLQHCAGAKWSLGNPCNGS